jgi:two-component system LytT family response regulator
VRILIVDDEPHARALVRSILEDADDVEIVAECANGRTALESVAATRPDLLVLDVEMPGMSGFDVLAALPAGYRPAVIFVTAYETFAPRAFDVQAVDYVLKPIEPGRLHVAISRARAALAGWNREPGGAPRVAPRPTPARDRIPVTVRGRVRLLPVADIDWVDSDGNYVQLHVRGETYRIRETLTELEKALDPATFVRVHRSRIVNSARVVELEPLNQGDYALVLASGKRVLSGRAYRENVLRLAGWR